MAWWCSMCGGGENLIYAMNQTTGHMGTTCGGCLAAE
jgi:hypothetical protein